MAENIPPDSAGKALVSNESTTRGLPYYEKLRRDLRDTLQRKRILDKNMASLEETIHLQETAYLEETSSAGNIIKGFDNYIKSSTTSALLSSSNNATNSTSNSGTISGSAAGGASGPATARRKTLIVETDRVFSRSSVGYARGEVAGEGEGDGEGRSATTTPGGLGMPAAMGSRSGSGSGNGGGGGGGGQTPGGSAVGAVASSVKGAERKKKKKGAPVSSAVVAAAAAEEESSEMEGKPSKRARISYGPRE